MQVKPDAIINYKNLYGVFQNAVQDFDGSGEAITALLSAEHELNIHIVKIAEKMQVSYTDVNDVLLRETKLPRVSFNMKVHALIKPYLTSDRIFEQALQASLKQKPIKFVHQRSGDIEEWPGWTWQLINEKYLKNNSVYDGLHHLIRSKLCHQARLWLTSEEGEKWTEKSPDSIDYDASLPDYPGVTFKICDTMLQNMAGKAQTSLQRLLLEDKVLSGLVIDADSLTDEVIFVKILETMRIDPESLRFPTRYDEGEISGWPGWNWMKVEHQIKKRGQYRDLADFTSSKIIEQTQKWRNSPENKKWLKQSFPCIDENAVFPDYPEINFAMCNAALQHPSKKPKMTIDLLLLEKNIVSGILLKTDDLTPDLVFEKMLEQQAADKKAGKIFQASERDRPVLGWPGWKWSGIYHYVHTRTEYKNLPNLYIDKVGDQATLWLESEEGKKWKELNLTKFINMKARLPASPRIKFQDCDEFLFQSRRMTLEKALLEKNIIEGKQLVNPETLGEKEIFAKVLGKLQEKKPQFVTADSGPIDGWQDWTWRKMNRHVSENLDYDSLSHFIRHHVCRQVNLWKESAEGKQWKVRNKNQFIDYEANLPEYPGFTFSQCDAGYKNMKGAAVSTLEKVYTDKNISEEKIFAKILEDSIHPRKPHFVTATSGKVSGWKDWTYLKLDTYVKHRLGYTSLSHFIRHHIGVQAAQWRESPEGWEWRKKNSDKDINYDAPLPGYPLVTFRQCDRAYQNMGGGGKTTLQAVLEKEKALEKPVTMKVEYLTLDLVFKKVLEIMQNPQSPDYQRFAIDGALVEGWDDLFWSDIHEFSENKLGKSLQQAIDEKICQQAKKFMNKKERTILNLKGKMPDYADVSFENIDTALRNTLNIRLEDVLIKHGLVPQKEISKKDLNAQVIFFQILKTLMQHSLSSFVTEFSGRIDDWPGWDWKKVNLCLKKMFNQSVSQFTHAQVTEQALKWLVKNNTGQLDFNATLPDYPAVTFRRCDKAFKMATEKYKTSLEKLMEQCKKPEPAQEAGVENRHMCVLAMNEQFKIVSLSEGLKFSKTCIPRIYPCAAYPYHAV
jgi:hypothetical protein